MIDGHEALAKRVIGGVQRDGEMRTHGLAAEFGNARNDARGGNRHARFGNACTFDQELHRAHEVFIVQERFALTHEHQVDAVAAEFDLMIIENQQHLPHDFSGAEVALQAKQGGHAEPAIDGASGLGGDAEGCPQVSAVAGGMAAGGIRRGGSGKKFLGVFHSVAIRHPNGFDGLAVGETDEVADGTVLGYKTLIDGRQSGAISLGRETRAQGFWQV